MATGPDCSDETLFAQMLAHRLRTVSTSQMSDFESDLFSEPYHYYSEQASVRIVNTRLGKLETSVERLESKMDAILARLTAAPVLSPERAALLAQSPARRGIRKKHVRSDSDGSASPALGHQWVCPLCLKPQNTPKSHCEHLKNAVEVGGVHRVCRFVEEHTRHQLISQIFGSGENFVRWYCSFLRSGITKYNDTDVKDYQDLQQRLSCVLTGVLPLPQ